MLRVYVANSPPCSIFQLFFPSQSYCTIVVLLFFYFILLNHIQKTHERNRNKKRSKIHSFDYRWIWWKFHKIASCTGRWSAQCLPLNVVSSCFISAEERGEGLGERSPGINNDRAWSGSLRRWVDGKKGKLCFQPALLLLVCIVEGKLRQNK